MQEKPKIQPKLEPKIQPKPEPKPKVVTVYTGGGCGEKKVDANLIIQTQNNGIK